MERIERSLTKQQREELEGIVALSTQVSRAILFAVFVIVVGAVFRWVQHLVMDSMPLWLIPTAMVAVSIYIWSCRWTGGRDLRRKVREDLEAGHLIMTVIEPRYVEEVEELEDEGASYIIEASDGNAYLLTGQEMGRYKSRKFPWAKIGIMETPRSKRFLGLKRLGDPVSVEKTRPPFTYRQAKELGCFGATFIQLDERKRRLLHETSWYD